MSNLQEKIVPQPQFEYIFNSELSHIIDFDNQQTLEGYKSCSILYRQEIMICDLILLLEQGKMRNEKLSISGYLKLMDLIQEFGQIQYVQNQFTILNYCVIKNRDGKLLVESKMQFDINYPSLTDQIDELQAKFSQFVDEKNIKCKELEEMLVQAFHIYSQFNSPLKKKQNHNKNDEMFYYIQNRFFNKQYLINQSNDEETKSLKYFQEIFEKIQSQPNCIQILDLLIEADFRTLEQIYQFVKKEEFQHSDVCIIKDFELNKYFKAHLSIAQQKIKEKNVFAKSQELGNNMQSIENQFNTNIQNLMNNQIKENTQQLEEFSSPFINQLKIYFWVFLDKLLQEQVQELNDQISEIYKKYSQSIQLKLENKHQLEKLIRIIINHNDMEKMIEKILESKIKLIHKQVLNSTTTLNKDDLNKNLTELLAVNKQIYLPKLKNHPSLTQQVDIILDYCERINIMIENFNENKKVDFRNKEQVNILQKSFKCPNYENIDLQSEIAQELLEVTNRFCPNLCISKSTKFQTLKTKIEYKISKYKLWTQIDQKYKSEIKSNVQAEVFNQYQFHISKFMQKPQDFDQLQCALYDNKTWDNFRNSLIKQFQKQIEEQYQNNFAYERLKMQNQYQNRIFIPIEKIDVIYKNSFEQQNEKNIMEEIGQFFDKMREEEEQILSELQEYVELTDECIKAFQLEKINYFKQFVYKTEYQSIKELKDDVQINIKTFRNQNFEKYYQVKSLIETIHNEYFNKCQQLFKNPPQNFKRYRLERQNREDLNIKQQIITFYGSQLLENLKLQISNNSLF